MASIQKQVCHRNGKGQRQDQNDYFQKGVRVKRSSPRFQYILATILLSSFHSIVPFMQYCHALPYMTLTSTKQKCMLVTPEMIDNSEPITLSISYSAPNLYIVGEDDEPKYDAVGERPGKKNGGSMRDAVGDFMKSSKVNLNRDKLFPHGNFDVRQLNQLSDITFSIIGNIWNKNTKKKRSMHGKNKVLQKREGVLELELDVSRLHYHESLDDITVCIQSFRATPVTPSFLSFSVKEKDLEYEKDLKEMKLKQKEARAEGEAEPIEQRMARDHFHYLERELLKLINEARHIDSGTIRTREQWKLFHAQSESLLKTMKWFPYLHWIILVGVSMYSATSLISFLKKKMII